MTAPVERDDPRFAHLTVRSGCLISTVALLVCALALLAGYATFGGYDPERIRKIVGVSMGDHGSTTRIPRRALACVETEPSRAAEVCSTTLDGAELTVNVAYAEPSSLRFRACSATYRGTTSECWATWYALTGGLPRYAAIPIVGPGQPHETTQWLGIGRVDRYTEPHLEVSEEALAGIRQQYPLDNFLEREWMTVINTLALLATVTVFVLALVLTRLRLVQRWTARPRPILRSTLLPAIAWSAIVLVVAYLGLLLQAMRAGLVD
jgi:hypothetical protein